MRRASAVMVALATVFMLASVASAKVLRVGSYHGFRGQYATIQAAVRAARPGDWILIGPGDYKTRPNQISAPQGYPQFPAGVLITKRNLHIRGMNRNRVIVDGTKPGTARCSRADGAQNFGLAVKGSKPSGANGLMVWKAANVSIEKPDRVQLPGWLSGRRQRHLVERRGQQRPGRRLRLPRCLSERYQHLLQG